MRERNTTNPLAGLSAFGAYLRELREAEGLSLPEARRRLRTLGVTTRSADIADWEAGIRRPTIRAKAALTAILDGSPTQADMLVLYDLHATTTTARTIAATGTRHLSDLAAEYQAFGVSQARTWLQRRSLWRPAGLPAMMPVWLLEEIGTALGTLYAHDPALVTRLLHEALRQVDPPLVRPDTPTS